MSNLLTRAAAAIADGQTCDMPDSLRNKVIRRDGGTQMRSQIDAATLNEYINLIQENNNAWPFRDKPVVFFDGSDYWLADGFHRHQAWTECRGADMFIPVDVRSGMRRDAVLYAAGANADHGLRRSSEDKRRSVLALLNDAEWAQWSNREIARRCKVDEKTVRTLRTSAHAPAIASAENPQIEQESTAKSVPAVKNYWAPAVALSAENPQMEVARKFERGGKIHAMKLPEPKVVAFSPVVEESTPKTVLNKVFHYPERMLRICKSFQADVEAIAEMTKRPDLAKSASDAIQALIAELEAMNAAGSN